MQGNKRSLTNNPIENIKVIVRIRNKKINEKGTCSFINISDNKSIQVENTTYFFDYVANMNSTQEEIFQHCAKSICDNFLKGYNCTIFAYGQTGSGKTYTLLGPNITKFIEKKNNISFSLDNTYLEMSDLSQDNELMTPNEHNKSSYNLKTDIENSNQNIYNYDINDQGIGLIPRIIYYLFNKRDKSENIDYKYKLSYIEIYQENINDLLNPDNSKVQLRDIGSDIILVGLKKLVINSPDEALKYIIQGNKLRHTASTLMNNESSRSHAIISLYIEKIISQKIDKKIQKSVFHIIDLAGSEKQNKTGTNGERIRESGSINKSLLNLSIVIKDIIYNKKPVPYRDSKLTHFLKDSLGGNAKTSIIATISPFDSHLSEIKSTIIFAQNAKKVKNHAIINEEKTENEILRAMNISKKKNISFEDNIKVQKRISDNHNDNKNIDSCINDNEELEKRIEGFVKDILNLQAQNSKLKEQIDKKDFELTVKNKKIKDLYEKINVYIQNINNLIKEKIELSAINNILNEKLKEELLKNENLEKLNKIQKLLIEKNNKNIEEIIKNKNLLIYNLTEKMNGYADEINIKNRKIKALNENLEYKKKIFELMENKKIIELNKIKNKYEIDIKLKQKKINELINNNNDIKDKGKNLLQKYDEKINTINDNNIELKNIIIDLQKKLEKSKKFYNSLEEVKLIIEKKSEEKTNRISGYLGEIANLNQKYRILELKYDSLKSDYEKLNSDLRNNEINNIQYSKNDFNEETNNNFQSKKVEHKTSNSKKNSKSPSDDLNITLKNNSGVKNIKNSQYIFDKLKAAENDLNEYRRIMNYSFIKIHDILSKDMSIYGISNKQFVFDDISFEKIEKKFEVIFQNFLNYNMLIENQLKDKKEKDEILKYNINLNAEKKQAEFEINDNTQNSLNNLILNIAQESIVKSRKHYLIKNLSSNSKKIFDIYSKEFKEKLVINDEENIDENNSNSENIINKFCSQDINKKNETKINLYKSNSQNDNIFEKDKLNSNDNNIVNLLGNENAH